MATKTKRTGAGHPAGNKFPNPKSTKTRPGPKK